MDFSLILDKNNPVRNLFFQYISIKPYAIKF